MEEISQRLRAAGISLVLNQQREERSRRREVEPVQPLLHLPCSARHCGHLLVALVAWPPANSRRPPSCRPQPDLGEVRCEKEGDGLPRRRR
uniref:Uncharacterized protein n=1 Tax=Oryza meridionalis TaxID=40149 RepID=A0A0E0DVY0_9ORYZ